MTADLFTTERRRNGGSKDGLGAWLCPAGFQKATPFEDRLSSADPGEAPGE